jgi:hypothetical protein
MSRSHKLVTLLTLAVPLAAGDAPADLATDPSVENTNSTLVGAPDGVDLLFSGLSAVPASAITVGVRKAPAPLTVPNAAGIHDDAVFDSIDDRAGGRRGARVRLAGRRARDGMGRRSGLKIRSRKAWGFESPRAHHARSVWSAPQISKLIVLRGSAQLANVSFKPRGRICVHPVCFCWR